MGTIYDKIYKKAEPYLDTRQNDVHIQISYDFARRLLAHYPEAHEDIVLPAILLHDVGWKMVPEEKQLCAFGPKVKDKKTQRLHEVEGVRIAEEILISLSYGEEKTREILTLIDGHDTRQEADNAYQTEFEARVIDTKTIHDHQGVVLDRTFFYPTGGGQPRDTGTLQGMRVIDVIEQDEAVIHVMDGKITTGKVTGKVDWKRRFDHMQQHTGQHVLSQAFLQVIGAETIGFHLGEEVTTIDLATSGLTWETIHQVEDEANRVVFQNLPVRVHEATKETLSQFPLRKSPVVEGSIRILEVDHYDWSACCGTHVRATGEIGLIKIVRFEKYKHGSRVTFLCGHRTLRAMQRKTEIMETASRRLTFSETELIEGIDRLLDQQKRLKKLEKQLLVYEAAERSARARKVGELFFDHDLFTDRDVKSVQALCRQMTGNPKTICLFGIEADRATVILGQSEKGPLDLRSLTSSVSELLKGKGGGNQRQIQVSGTETCLLAHAMEKLIDQIVHELENARR
jgi:alanyl-tRNA synthetase